MSDTTGHFPKTKNQTKTKHKTKISFPSKEGNAAVIHLADTSRGDLSLLGPLGMSALALEAHDHHQELKKDRDVRYQCTGLGSSSLSCTFCLFLALPARPLLTKTGEPKGRSCMRNPDPSIRRNSSIDSSKMGPRRTPTRSPATTASWDWHAQEAPSWTILLVCPCTSLSPPTLVHTVPSPVTSALCHHLIQMLAVLWGCLNFTTPTSVLSLSPFLLPFPCLCLSVSLLSHSTFLVLQLSSTEIEILRLQQHQIS